MGPTISPCSAPKAACSNSGTVSPLPRQPRSPPFAALPGSWEFSLASSAKSPSFSNCCFTSSAFSFWSSVNRMCLTQRCVRHILFTEDQKEKAEDVKQQLENDGDFAELAKENSQDPGSAANGGDLGCLGKGETVPEFEQAAFGAEQGEIVGPVQTEFGYHILQVTDVKPEQTRSLQEVESQIRSQLATEKQSEEFNKWIEEQKKERDVKYLKGYEPPDQG